MDESLCPLKTRVPPWVEREKVKSIEQFNCFMKKAFSPEYSYDYPRGVTWGEIMEVLPEPGRSYLVENIDHLIRLTEKEIEMHLECSEEHARFYWQCGTGRRYIMSAGHKNGYRNDHVLRRYTKLIVTHN